MNSMADVFTLRIPHSTIGNGAIGKTVEVVKKLGGKKVLIVTDPGIVKAGILDTVKQALGEGKISYGLYDQCKTNSYLSDMRKGAQLAQEGKYDVIIGLGGGSAMDTAKMAAIIAANSKDVKNEDLHSYLEEVPGRESLPTIMIPTTSGTGSEWTFFAAVLDDETDGQKKGAYYPAILPQAVILDPKLTINLPQKVTRDTGLDAFCHAMEVFFACGANVISDMLAGTAIELISSNLRNAYGKGARNVEARYNMAIGSMMATTCFAFTGVTLGHAYGSSLQVLTNCTHGEACAVVLPYVMEFNLISSMPKLAKIAELMGEKIEGLTLSDAAKKSVEAVKKLLSDVDMPLRLRDIGLKKEDLKKVVDNLFDINLSMTTGNPRDFSREEALGILEAAW